MNLRFLIYKHFRLEILLFGICRKGYPYYSTSLLSTFSKFQRIHYSKSQNTSEMPKKPYIVMIA